MRTNDLMDHPTADINLWTGNSPITEGRLQDFIADPIACMKQLHRDHGDLAACASPSNSSFSFSVRS